MKRTFTPSLLSSLAALSFIIAQLFLSPNTPPVPYRFEVRLAASARGHARIYFDLGHGFSEDLSAQKPIDPGNALQRYRFEMPFGTYRGLRLEPIDGPATVTVADARIVTKDNAVIRMFSPGDLLPARGTGQIVHTTGRLILVTATGASAPILNFNWPDKLTLNPPSAWPGLAWRFGAAYLACLALAAVLPRWYAALPKRAATLPGQIRGYFRLHRVQAVAAVALFAVVVNCYPIIFLGRSFVSPNFGITLLYAQIPNLPGYHDTIMESGHGSDVGAMPWYSVPESMVEHRALFHDGELPLWNRYNSAGTTLLGQGQSMFGDPLHMLVVAANGAAWAWDLKFLVAKWLLALGLGLIVLHSTRHLPSAALTAFSAPFIGFFLYRLNHPAFFSFCYAPWILYCWCRLVAAPTWRNGAIWSAGLLVACWSEMNSGTVKEAYMLLFSMNLSGLVVLVFADISRRGKLQTLLLAAWTGGMFTLISAPVWLTFIDTLKAAFTCYADPQVFQIHPAVLLGLFDEIFYRPLQIDEGVYNPAANFLVLLGVLYALATFRRTPINRLKIAIALGALVPLAIAFGLVPPDWIVKIPFVANIIHISDVFSPILIIHLIVLAGFGYQAAAARLGTPEGRGDLMTAGFLLFALVFPYLALTQTNDHSAFPTLYWGPRLPVSPFVWGSLVSLLAASVLLALVTRRTLIRGGWSAARAILAGTCLITLLWRQGPQARIGFDTYVFHPAIRADFHATSPVLESMLDPHGPPIRATGFEYNLFPGWSGVYGLEGICGPDALINPYYRELLESCGVDRPWIWRYAVHANTLAGLKPVYDFLNIKYYLGLHADESLVSPILQTTKTDDPEEVYISDTAWPRAFFTDRLAVYDTPAALGQLIHDGDGRPFAAIESTDRAQAPMLSADLASRTVIPAVDYRLTSNTTSFEVTTKGPGLIALQESWLKDDFHVEVNGRPTKYLRINHAFKGIAIDAAGTYQVTFAYWPHHFTLALALAAAGTLLFVAGTCWLWRMDAKKSSIQVPVSA